jgi:ABC-type multidrug transport system fused ATPase/permease subunit
MIPTEKIRARLSLWRYLPRILRMARHYRVHAIAGLTAWIASALLSLLYPVALGDFIDKVLKNGDLDALPGLAIFVGVIIVVRALADMLRAFFLSRARESSTAHARLDLHNRVLQAPLPLIEKHKSAALHDRVMRDLGSVMGLIFNSGPRFIQSLCLALGALTLMLFRDLQLALIGLLFLPPFILIMIIWVRRLRPRYKALWEERSQLGATLQQHYAGARVLQGFNRQEWAVSQARDEQMRLADNSVRLQRESAVFAIAPSLVIGAGLIAILTIGARRVASDPDMTAGQLTVIIGLMALFAGSIASIVALANTIQQSLASAERVFEIADMAPRDDTLGKASVEKIELADLTIENLTFAYPEREDTPVLDGLSLSIAPGQVAALVGSSGAGKTTTTALLARFLEPQSGRILWGNRDIADIPLPHWRSSIAIVHQEDWLLAATLRDNLALGREDLSDDQLWQLLETACADAIVKALPDGLDTVVGERGHDLSGGERQRLCLARAIAGHPRLLILDEATAALDLQTENRIFQNLSKIHTDTSVLLISHRLTAIAAADVIHVLHNRRITESGSHDELLAHGQHYPAMLQLQRKEAAAS